MGITEDTKHARHKDSERISSGSLGQSSIQGTGDRSANIEPQDRVDQVREILFGTQREEYDRRFNRIEELLVKNISDLSNETTAKFGDLRDDYDKRISRLEESLVKNLSDLNNETTKKFTALRNEYDKKIAHLEELIVKSISDLNNDTTKQLDALGNNIAELRQEKVDKAAVSKLLKKILKVSHDLNVAKSEDASDE
jgi:hypothetical protein